MKPFLPFSRALITWPPEKQFSPITPQGCIFTLRHAGWFGISVQKYVENYLQVSEILKYKDFWEFLGEWFSICEQEVSLAGRLSVLWSDNLCSFAWTSCGLDRIARLAARARARTSYQRANKVIILKIFPRVLLGSVVDQVAGLPTWGATDSTPSDDMWENIIPIQLTSTFFTWA